jgi:hypothetical protein
MDWYDEKAEEVWLGIVFCRDADLPFIKVALREAYEKGEVAGLKEASRILQEKLEERT